MDEENRLRLDEIVSMSVFLVGIWFFVFFSLFGKELIRYVCVVL